MAGTYQTVIYDKPSGTILAVHPNLYISSKTHLANMAGRSHWKDTAFLYFPYELPLDPAVHKVKRLTSNSPASLVSSDGIPIDFAVIIQARNLALTQGANCLVEFEGGMGDQLMEAAAILTAMATYKNSTFSIRCESKYLEILRSIPGLCRVEPSYVGQAKQEFTFTISNHTQYISDPRGGMFGKASLYGAWLGLEEVKYSTSIKLPKAAYQAEANFLQENLQPKAPLNVICQFRSASGHAKSWQHEKVLTLAALLNAEYGARVFVVGAPNELPRGAPHVVDLTGKTSWWQSCLLLSKMDMAVTIDSGLMHLARSLKIPHIVLWGGTNAQVILGQEEGPHDIRLRLDCWDLVCYDCQRKRPICMEQITPEQVFENARLLFHNTHSK